MSKDYNLETLTYLRDLTSVWQKEAGDFTPWLAKNLNLLAESLGVDALELVNIEVPCDKYRADIIAEIPVSHKKVVVENQLSPTDHDHLGKAITYAAWQNASIVVWVTKKAEPAHRLAIKWLNEHTEQGVSFFLVQIELWKIGSNARPAPRLTVVERPNEVQKEEPLDESPELSGTSKLLYEFWDAFKECAEQRVNFGDKYRFHRPYRGDSWYNISVGNSRYYINFVIRCRKKTAEAGIYFSNCIAEYEKFCQHGDSLGELFPENEVLHSNSGTKDRRIFVQRKSDISDRDSWASTFDWYIDMALRFKALIDKVSGC